MKPKFRIAALAVAISFVIVISLVLTFKNHPQENVETQQVEQVDNTKELRQQKRERLAQLARDRGGLPIEQALGAAQTERQREFLKKDMGYQVQSDEDSRREVLERLSEVEGQLNSENDPKKVALLEKQVEMLEVIAKRFE